MSGVHDLGGKPGFGSIPMVDDDREYKERWEFVLMGMTRSAYATGPYRADSLRYVIERIEPSYYLTAPYYGRMLLGAAYSYIEAGALTFEDLQRHTPENVTWPRVSPPLPAHTGHPDNGDPNRFAVGDRVTVRNDFPEGRHVRAPGYVRGRTGKLIRKGHMIPFPGQACFRDPAPRERTWLVQFERADLWPDSPERGAITVDLWDSYLLPAA